MNKLAAGLLVLFLANAADVVAVEKLAYDVLAEDGAFELRQYPEHVIAEIEVDADFSAAGSAAFRPLAEYITGDNASGSEIAMTAPVNQVAGDDGFRVSFIMPSSYRRSDLPAPDDARISVREVNARRMAAIRYSGTWSRERFEQHLSALRQWLDDQDLEATGEPVWSRYNGPFTPWFMRRNEILLPLADGADVAAP